MGNNFNINVTGNKIQLTGNLEAKHSDTLDKILSGLKMGNYEVVAGNMTLDPEAVEAWITAVNNNLTPQHQLRYSQSQLAFILHDDKRYKHQQSTFLNPYI